MTSGAATMERPGRYTDQYMPTEAPVYRITDIDLSRWANEGVKLLMVDVEACLGETGSEQLEVEHVKHIQEAHEVIPHIALWSNKKIRTEDDRDLVAGWGDQVGADAIFTPIDSSQRKPSPVNAYKAMQMFGVKPSETGVIDDKASAGVRGGSFAGMEHRAWTRAFGDDRHIGDRIVRDPFEAILRVRAHLLLTPTFREQLAVDPEEIADMPLSKMIDLFDGPDGQDKIVGYGIEDIALDESILQTLKQPAYRQALKTVKDIADYYGEQPVEQLKNFLHEHGRTTADGLVLFRLLAAFGVAAVSRSNMKADVKQKLTLGLVAGAYASDAVDGFAARRHKDGATKKGGALDQNVDKFLSIVVDIFPLISQQLMSNPDFVVTAAREFGVTAVRRPFKQRGIDTSSVLSGKISTGAKAAIQGFSLVAGKRYPIANRLLQHTATGLKVASMVHAPFVWIEKHEMKQHEALQRQLGACGLIAAHEL